MVVWFVPDKKPVAGEKKIEIQHSEVWQMFLAWME